MATPQGGSSNEPNPKDVERILRELREARESERRDFTELPLKTKSTSSDPPPPKGPIKDNKRQNRGE